MNRSPNPAGPQDQYNRQWSKCRQAGLILVENEFDHFGSSARNSPRKVLNSVPNPGRKSVGSVSRDGLDLCEPCANPDDESPIKNLMKAPRSAIVISLVVAVCFITLSHPIVSAQVPSTNRSAFTPPPNSPEVHVDRTVTFRV